MVGDMEVNRCWLRSGVCAAAMLSALRSPTVPRPKQLPGISESWAEEQQCNAAGMQTLTLEFDMQQCRENDWTEGWTEQLRQAFDNYTDSRSEKRLLVCAPVACLPARGQQWGWGQLYVLWLWWRGTEATDALLQQIVDEQDSSNDTARDVQYNRVRHLDCSKEFPRCASVRRHETGHFRPIKSTLCCEDGSCSAEEEVEWNWFLQQSFKLTVGYYNSNRSLPAMFRYADRPELNYCPIGRLILKLNHLVNYFYIFYPDLRKGRVKWTLFKDLFDRIVRLRWADLVRTGWGVPLFAILHELSVKFCDYSRDRTVVNQDCEWDYIDMPKPMSWVIDDQLWGYGQPLVEQMAWVAEAAESKAWHDPYVEGTVMSPAGQSFLVIALAEMSRYTAVDSTGENVDEVLDTAQAVFQWYGGYVVQAEDPSLQPRVSTFLDLLRTTYMLWASLNSISCRTALVFSQVRHVPESEMNDVEKVSRGLAKMWGLEPSDGWPSNSDFCESCEAKYGWVAGGKEMPKRSFRAVDSCDGSQTYPVVSLIPDLGVYGRVIHVAIAEMPGRLPELEWMVDFHDFKFIDEAVKDPKKDSKPDVCGYRWEMELAGLICIFDNGFGSFVSVQVPTSFSGENFYDQAAMNPGPPTILSCALPVNASELKYPMQVSIRPLHQDWKNPLNVTLCPYEKSEVPLAICTRPLYQVGPDFPDLENWLTYYVRLGVPRIYLYDTDGTASHVMNKFPPGIIEYFPNFHTRGNSEWFDILEREGRWNWNHTMWYPKMGCSLAHANHCILHARGRAKYLLQARALDKFFVSPWKKHTLKHFLDHIERAAADVAPLAIGAIPIETFDYWDAKPCNPNCVDAHRMRAEHGVPAKRDRFLHLVNPAQFLVQGPHQIWVQKRAEYLELRKGDFWMAHYLRAFDRNPESQVVNPVKRWRFPLCEDALQEMQNVNREGRPCSVLRQDEIAALTYRDVMGVPGELGLKEGMKVSAMGKPEELPGTVKEAVKVAASIVSWMGRELTSSGIEVYYEGRRKALQRIFLILAGSKSYLLPADIFEAFNLTDSGSRKLYWTKNEDVLAVLIANLKDYGVHLEAKVIQNPGIFSTLDQDTNGRLDDNEFVTGIEQIVVMNERERILQALGP